MNENQFSTDQARWAAVVQRDREAEGAFVYGVVTTSVYCRPGCASRLPNRENVRFFDAWPEAEQAGFRPCKRCQPQLAGRPAPQNEAIVRACQLIEEAETPPSLNELAEVVGLSPYYFHRLFKKTVGVTPKQYAMEKRLGRVRDTLQQDATVTEAMYNAGFASSGRFYEQATTALGMRPAAYQNGAQGLPIWLATKLSYLGWVLVAATAQGICAIEFGESPEMLSERLRDRFPQAEFQDSDPAFEATVAQVLAFLESPQQGLDLPLDVQGTAFQRRVWLALQQIPAGATMSYGDVAARIGSPKAGRAVAQACASNGIAVAIPCHRVVRGNGELGGYRWGIERKRALLEREAAEGVPVG
ncbi:MAG: bifunctional DNA-binding transcriptional regulator/O6-methylguanine-DNA methyltransferase Ada [Chloroflexi bacterium]|nr:bifunctional DNA-binding transcriptional regulator/O6-methylguanine-DNA methyltransferase Ada [Chloroflexota bacterium]MCI0576642.1 bifunctional DNA-binding transcriptional regulator/O6-methylguanine-DNA methyltransferase Ada [Chloroflexota bacterium]MCI0646990.1 bifunctional DNA-binding transcriptional regulator/O6-methylguanine-DNA methyltransferase Ada [Chloroflexota bacterium]MCI0730690.1 bifunctional DNA-binding transcriptional regulator/O6-methylguanine-DNA methyltransferase Ada [Chloro